MNLSVDFVERFEQAKESFKHSITQQVDLWFAPLLAELKAAKAYQHHFDSSHLLLPDNRRDLNGSRTRNPSRVDLNVSGSRQLNSEAPPLPPASGENANAHSHASGTRTSQISLQSTPQTIPRSVLNISQAQPSTSKSLRTFFKQEDNGENDTPQQQQLLDSNSSDAQLDENDLLNCDCADCTDGKKEDQEAAEDNQSDLSISVEDEDEGGRQRPSKKRRMSPMIPNVSSAESDSHGPDFASLAAQILNASEAIAGSGGGSAGSVGVTQPPKRSRRPYVKVPPGELTVRCPVTGCSRAFRKQSELTVHLWVHRGIRPFLCRWEGCDQKFTQRSNGISHIRKIHLKLPNLLKDQIELGIVDSRDPADWLEINPECR